jgi:PAS domain S-box-containing protein
MTGRRKREEHVVNLSSHPPRPANRSLIRWLRELFEGSPAALVGLDPEGKVALWSQGAETLFGWTRDEVLGKRSPLIPPGGKQEFETLFALNFEGKSPTVRQLTRLRRGGEQLVVNLSTSPICDEPGTVVMVLGVFVDTTEQRRAEAALLRSEARYRRLTENAPDLIWRADAKGRITFASSAVSTLLGYAPKSFIGTEPEDYLTPESAGRLRDWLSRVADDLGLDTRFRSELLYVDCDGTTIPCECRVVVERDESGSIVGVEGISRDIRHRRKAEKQRTELQQQLFQAQKTEAIGRLAGGVAHDFNNILTAIIGSAEFLEQEHGSSSVGQEAREILSCARRGAKLTTDLLAFSRRQPHAPRLMQPELLVGKARTMLERVVGEDVDLRFLIEQQLGSIRADRGQLEQVLINLTLNAKDAMPDGGCLTIELSRARPSPTNTESKHRSGSFVRLRVQDNGCGMPAEVVSRAFEPFFTTKPQRAGSGLGLAMVHGIIEQHGGVIEVSSEVGVGTTFDVFLPTVTDQSKNSAPPPMLAQTGGAETILLVEDEKAVRDTVRRQLTRLGYHVLEAKNGADALRVLEERPDDRVDLMLTDVVMPGMSGTALFEELSKLQPSLRVLFMSGYPDGTAKLDFAADSGRALLAKPFSIAELDRALRAELDRQV